MEEEVVRIFDKLNSNKDLLIWPIERQGSKN